MRVTADIDFAFFDQFAFLLHVPEDGDRSHLRGDVQHLKLPVERQHVRNQSDRQTILYGRQVMWVFSQNAIPSATYWAKVLTSLRSASAQSCSPDATIEGGLGNHRVVRPL